MDNPFEPFEDPAEVEHFRQGFAHLQAGRYWEAHESWEEVWLPRDGAEAKFLQAAMEGQSQRISAQKLRQVDGESEPIWQDDRLGKMFG